MLTFTIYFKDSSGTVISSFQGEAENLEDSLKETEQIIKTLIEPVKPQSKVFKFRPLNITLSRIAVDIHKG